MPIVPTTDLGRITFYEAHIAGWTARAGAIGLSGGDCAALAARIATARAAFDAQQAAINAARAATAAMHQAVRAMRDLGAADIARIRSFAEATGDPGVFARASIPAPAAPSRAGPPGTPYAFTAALLQSGAVVLRWKCRNPEGTTGTVYEVRRRLGGSGGFEHLGTGGTKSFTDATIPGGGGDGGGSAMYQVAALRSTRRGEPARFAVNFGVSGGTGGTGGSGGPAFTAVPIERAGRAAA